MAGMICVVQPDCVVQRLEHSFTNGNYKISSNVTFLLPKPASFRLTSVDKEGVFVSFGPASKQKSCVHVSLGFIKMKLPLAFFLGGAVWAVCLEPPPPRLGNALLE